MHKETMDAIFHKIKEYDTVMLFRHFRPDGDCKGATKGLQRILQLSFPEKKILLINDDHSDYLAFLGDDDTVIRPDAMETPRLSIEKRLDIGPFSFLPRTGGNLSLRYTGN